MWLQLYKEHNSETNDILHMSVFKYRIDSFFEPQNITKKFTLFARLQELLPYKTF